MALADAVRALHACPRNSEPSERPNKIDHDVTCLKIELMRQDGVYHRVWGAIAPYAFGAVEATQSILDIRDNDEDPRGCLHRLPGAEERHFKSAYHRVRIARFALARLEISCITLN